MSLYPIHIENQPQARTNTANIHKQSGTLYVHVNLRDRGVAVLLTLSSFVSC